MQAVAGAVAVALVQPRGRVVRVATVAEAVAYLSQRAGREIKGTPVGLAREARTTQRAGAVVPLGSVLTQPRTRVRVVPVSPQV